MSNNYKKIIQDQSDFFYNGNTLDLNFRIDMLKKLKNAIKRNEDRFIDALKTDLNKSSCESFFTEIGSIYAEIDYHIRNLKKWAKPKRVKTPLTLFPGSSYIYNDPYGVCLIISPWNYPLQLSIIPLIGAISAGNTVILKPSELSPFTSTLIVEIINSTFEMNYIYAISGGIEETTELLKERFDLIFFTGSEKVGKIVMESASKFLTPVILELGGKSPAIVDKNCDINIAAKRIAFGKLMNSGQTCVAPDYLLIHTDVMNDFVTCFKKHTSDFFEKNTDKTISVVDNVNCSAIFDRCLNEYSSLGKIINEKNFYRLLNLLKDQDIIYGGYFDSSNLKIEPTLVNCGHISSYPPFTDFMEKSPIMEDEIFGPILPIIRFDDIEDCIKFVNFREKPLALYIFSSNPEIQNKIVGSIFFGGGCINDTILHLANSNLGFGGVGNSGMGKYHGKYSFEAFSHQKSIYKNSTFFDISLRYMPYTDNKLSIFKRLFK